MQYLLEFASIAMVIVALFASIAAFVRSKGKSVTRMQSGIVISLIIMLVITQINYISGILLPSYRNEFTSEDGLWYVFVITTMVLIICIPHGSDRS